VVGQNEKKRKRVPDSTRSEGDGIEDRVDRWTDYYKMTIIDERVLSV
jgi:hypothetical protein